MNSKFGGLGRAILREFPRRFLLGVVPMIPVLIVFNTSVAEVYTINGASMHPFFNSDINTSLQRDKVLNIKWSPREGLQRGMIVTLR
jgi:mitochondrial inner membrane protease subunit 2